MRAIGITRLVGILALAASLAWLGGPVAAQSAKPNYLPFAEFSPRDTQTHIDLKKAYNDAVEKYNQVLYDYYATLEQHDRLVDLYQSSTDPAERQRARDEATPLRAKLSTLRGEAATAFTAVERASRRASAVGVSLKP
jgi:hypothetical protein